MIFVYMFGGIYKLPCVTREKIADFNIFIFFDLLITLPEICNIIFWNIF